MTSRERVLRAINFQTPDRVPIDLGGTKSSGIAASTYDRVKKLRRDHEPHPSVGLPVHDLDGGAGGSHAVSRGRSARGSHRHRRARARPDREWVPRTLFDGTKTLLPPGTSIREDAEGNWVLLNADGTATSYRLPRGGFYFDDLSFNKGDRIDPSLFRPQSDIDEESLRLLSDHARRLYRDTDYALLGWGYGVCFLGLSLVTDRMNNVTQGLPDQWMMMLMTEKETCHEMMGRSVDAAIQCLKLVKEAVGDTCFAWGIASDDSGTQRREFINPDLWAEMIKPHYTRLCSWVHANTSMKTYFHCCGSIPNLIPHLIDAGVDILESGPDVRGRHGTARR